MYSLTLSADDRHAFDWVGDRYAAGEIARLLTGCMSGDDAWSDPGEMTFTIPESTAWRIHELAEEEGFLWPCFALDLAARLSAFCASIV